MKTNTISRDEFLSLLGKHGNTGKGRHAHPESQLQRQCVAWFRAQYSGKAKILFAVPNGGARSRTEAGVMSAEGVTAGVADLILLEAHGPCGALCVEIKTEERSSRQSGRQKAWAEAAVAAGNKYIVVRTLEEFISAVNEYLSLPKMSSK